MFEKTPTAFGTCRTTMGVMLSPPPAWLAAHAKPGARIGYDPLLSAEEGLARYTDAGLTMVMPSASGITLVKVEGWYDNEWGYANRLVDLTLVVGGSVS